MKILAIETSCDETAAAVTEGRRVLSNIIFSQVDIHKKWGGVYPSLARREHEKKIDLVVQKALKNARIKDLRKIDAVAVTFGPGLVIALEVGIGKAKQLAFEFNKPLVPVDHLEGHIYSVFAQNRAGNPKRPIKFPFLALVVSGGHTGLVMVSGHQQYEILGWTLDDAAGESLDKAAKMLGLGYPGGPIVEKLAKNGQESYLDLPIPMAGRTTLDFSYSGLKTAFKYALERMPQKRVIHNLADLSASFQGAVFDQLIDRLDKTLSRKKFDTLVVGGGVIVNKKLRWLIRQFGKKNNLTVYLPSSVKLTGDNAAMIGVAACYKFRNGIYLKDDFSRLDRVARPDLKLWLEDLSGPGTL